MLYREKDTPIFHSLQIESSQVNLPNCHSIKLTSGMSRFVLLPRLLSM